MKTTRPNPFAKKGAADADADADSAAAKKFPPKKGSSKKLGKSRFQKFAAADKTREETSASQAKALR